MTLATTSLPPLSFKPPMTMHELFSTGSSAAGYSAISGYLTCPQYSFLRASGLRKKSSGGYGSYELDPLGFGSLAHAFAATRVVHGEEFAHDWLMGFKHRGEICDTDFMKMSFLFKVCDSLFPLKDDPFQYLGIELEVYTDIKDRAGEQLIRTVRYDAVVKYPNGDVYTFERKTASRGGAASLQAYWPQAMVQCMLWNSNEALVAQHGRMRGVIFEHLVKTETPKVDRIGPLHFSKLQHTLALNYMRLPETAGFVRNADGSYPQFLHSCYGRWRPCDYVNFCHEDAHGDYEYRQTVPGEEAE